jgi:hypothetical protein
MAEYSGLRLPSFFQRREAKARKKFEPIKFRPVRRNPLKAQTKIRMVNSVHGKFKDGVHYNMVAGKSYWVDSEKADEFIVKGYAEGNLSRKYSDDEVAAILAGIQVIDMDQGGLVNG